MAKTIAEMVLQEVGAVRPSSKRATIVVGGKNDLKKSEKQEKNVQEALKKALNDVGSVERLAFEVDPTTSRYSGIWKEKRYGIPDKLLKRIVIQDDLVAAIVQARQHHVAPFGRPRPDRFSTGFVIEASKKTLEKIKAIKDPHKRRKVRKELKKRVDRATSLFASCGHTNLDLVGNQDRLNLGQWLSMSARNAIVLGRAATEVIWKRNPDGTKEFAAFRIIDASTIYRMSSHKDAAQSVRERAAALLEKVNQKEINVEKLERDEYDWVQVIEGVPRQVFSSDECLVHNFYSVPDHELDGYPITPLDTAITAVLTHINITTHNKLYFQSGRAARGMLVVSSEDEVDQQTIDDIRQQWNAQINSVNNSWRMPVFGMGEGDQISWQPIDSGSRDMEFQYLSDMNARVIMSAFQISPDELPGWSYLSRGTNNQALSESNQEYKLQAARDVGIRPLLANLEDFLNFQIFPLLDPWLSKSATIKLVGLEAETAEKENQRLQQDIPVHMTMDEVLSKVEKRTIGKLLGGEYPLNPQIQQVHQWALTVGQILEHFFGVKDASKDETLAYRRDPFWFQHQQMLMQAKMQEQAAQQGGGPPQGGGTAPPPQGADTGGQPQEAPTERQKTEAQGELTTAVGQALGALSKAEKDLPPNARSQYAAQKALIRDFLDGWKQDVRHANKKILDSIKHLK